MTNKQLYKAALAIIERAEKLIPDKDHWVKGTGYKVGKEGQARYCVNAALDQASLRSSFEAREWARYAIHSAIDSEDIPTWNDAPNRRFRNIPPMFARAKKLIMERINAK